MSNLDAVKEALEGLPKAVKQNATDLLERMEAVVEGIGDSDRGWSPPFLKLIQPTTGEIPDGAGIGSLVVGDEILVKKKGEALPVIPIRTWSTRQYWDPDPNSPTLLCNSPDAKTGYKYGQCYGCTFAQWEDGVGSACNKSKVFLAITADLAHIVQVSFTKGSFKSGNAWEAKLKRAGVSPYKRIYDLSTEKHAKAPTFLIGAEPSGDRPDPKIIGFLTALFASTSADRTEFLAKFYEGVKNKQASQPPALTSEDQAVEVEVIAASDQPADDKSDSKGYEL